MSDGNVETTTPLINVTEPQHWLHHDRDYSGRHAATCQCYGCRCNRGDEPIINTLAKMEQVKDMRRRIEGGEIMGQRGRVDPIPWWKELLGLLMCLVVLCVLGYAAFLSLQEFMRMSR